jgi:hypothetical protein
MAELHVMVIGYNSYKIMAINYNRQNRSTFSYLAPLKEIVRKTYTTTHSNHKGLIPWFTLINKYLYGICGTNIGLTWIYNDLKKI